MPKLGSQLAQSRSDSQLAQSRSDSKLTNRRQPPPLPPRPQSVDTKSDSDKLRRLVKIFMGTDPSPQNQKNLPLDTKSDSDKLQELCRNLTEFCNTNSEFQTKLLTYLTTIEETFLNKAKVDRSQVTTARTFLAECFSPKHAEQASKNSTTIISELDTCYERLILYELWKLVHNPRKIGRYIKGTVLFIGTAPSQSQKNLKEFCSKPQNSGFQDKLQTYLTKLNATFPDKDDHPQFLPVYDFLYKNFSPTYYKQDSNELSTALVNCHKELEDYIAQTNSSADGASARGAFSTTRPDKRSNNPAARGSAKRAKPENAAAGGASTKPTSSASAAARGSAKRAKPENAAAGGASTEPAASASAAFGGAAAGATPHPKRLSLEETLKRRLTKLECNWDNFKDFFSTIDKAFLDYLNKLPDEELLPTICANSPRPREGARRRDANTFETNQKQGVKPPYDLDDENSSDEEPLAASDDDYIESSDDECNVTDSSESSDPGNDDY